MSKGLAIYIALMATIAAIASAATFIGLATL